MNTIVYQFTCVSMCLGVSLTPFNFLTLIERLCLTNMIDIMIDIFFSKFFMRLKVTEALVVVSVSSRVIYFELCGVRNYFYASTRFLFG